MRNGGTIEAPTVAVHALDDSLLDADSGGLAVALGAGVGASISVNQMSSTVLAAIGGATVNSTTADLNLTATSSYDVDAVGVGLPRRRHARRRGNLHAEQTEQRHASFNPRQRMRQRPAMSWSRPWTIPMWMRMRPGWP